MRWPQELDSYWGNGMQIRARSDVVDAVDGTVVDAGAMIVDGGGDGGLETAAADVVDVDFAYVDDD